MRNYFFSLLRYFLFFLAYSVDSFEFTANRKSIFNEEYNQRYDNSYESESCKEKCKNLQGLVEEEFHIFLYYFTNLLHLAKCYICKVENTLVICRKYSAFQPLFYDSFNRFA